MVETRLAPEKSQAARVESRPCRGPRYAEDQIPIARLPQIAASRSLSPLGERSGAEARQLISRAVFREGTSPTLRGNCNLESFVRSWHEFFKRFLLSRGDLARDPLRLPISRTLNEARGCIVASSTRYLAGSRESLHPARTPLPTASTRFILAIISQDIFPQISKQDFE